MRALVLLGLFLLSACADRIEAPVVPGALSVGEPRKVYVGTTREFQNGVYGIGRADRLDLLDVTVSLPPNRTPGHVPVGGGSPNPERDFALAAMTRYPTPSAFQSALARDMRNAQRLNHPDVTVFVHGFNNSFTDAAFRIAQMAVDTERVGPVVTYSWPSRANPLGYEYDAESALFARDGLAELLRLVRREGARQITLIGHSMGGRLVMEVLRQMELSDPGWSATALDAVVLMSPDVGIDVFRSQTAHFEEWPSPFIIFKSERDRLLNISALLRGEEERLGNISDLSRVDDLPILFVDVTEFADGDWSNHFLPGTSPELLKLLRGIRSLDDGFLAGDRTATASVLGSSRIIGRTVTVAPAAGNR